MPTAPLSAFPIFDTRKPQDFVDAVNANFHHGDIDVHSGPSFRAVYNAVDLGRVSLHGASLTNGVNIASASNNGSFVLILMCAGEMRIRSGRAEVRCRPGGPLALLDFSRPTTIRQTSGFVNYTLRFTRQGLEDSLAALCGRPAGMPLVFSPPDPSRAGTQRMARIAWQVAEAFGCDPGLGESELLTARYEELLLSAMLTCMEHNHSHLLAKEPKAAEPRAVKLAEAYIQANSHKPIRMADLAAVTGTGCRSLQLAFQKSRGYSPSRFLQECRLAKAREMLVQAGPGVSVLAVASACGFASQSFFARLYRQRFGEKPSETLRMA
ncbi:AraC family transcriptional regulator [Fundidesulfovibrio agrisoli]|uniref:AraC family transcriptional regulator n=1 Tax=Fundidesulfovibrio agrisoli TaxID=2922717 RepID=UPI001FAC87BA|nr:AraC family transcriptional regulator [Fundidesulfovibrio agrisoli]